MALNGLVQHLEVLTPCPYAPRLLAFNARWRTYAQIPGGTIQQGIFVHRPRYPVLPWLLRGFWQGQVASIFCAGLARRRHRLAEFDAILSFDLASTGGLAWRLGTVLGVPACGWATGSDIRVAPRGRIGRVVTEALRRLDLVFYQSSELRTLAAKLLETAGHAFPLDRHLVRWRGVVAPEPLPGDDVRGSIRSALGLTDDQVGILYLGRIVRDKGVFELVDSFLNWGKGRPHLALILVGAIPGHDDSSQLEKKISSIPELKQRVHLLPACAPPRIWEYFRAADIFAFPSYREGMPNSLLEAMLGGLPAVAFSIPAVQEITQFGMALLTAPPHDFCSFARAILTLADNPYLRQQIGQSGRMVVRERFSLDANMREVVDRIQRILPPDRRDV